MSHENGRAFKKISFGSLTFCTDKLDKSRCHNSYFVNGNIFGRIEEILVSCSSHGSSHNRVCHKTVSVKAKPFRARRNILSDVNMNAEITTFVEVEFVDEVLEKQ